ncbi:hypothetical protein ACIDOF_37050, partial [Streptomyces sp. Da 82-17]
MLPGEWCGFDGLGATCTGPPCCGTEGRPPGVLPAPSPGFGRGVEAGPGFEGLGDDGGGPPGDVPGVPDGLLRGGAEDDGFGLVAVPPPEFEPPWLDGLLRGPGSFWDGEFGDVGMAWLPSPRGGELSELVGGGAELVTVGADAARLSTCVPIPLPSLVDGVVLDGEGLGADVGLGEVMPPGLEFPPFGDDVLPLSELDEGVFDGELSEPESSLKSPSDGPSELRGGESELGESPRSGPEGPSLPMSAETVLLTLGPSLFDESEFEESESEVGESDVGPPDSSAADWGAASVPGREELPSPSGPLFAKFSAPLRMF